MMREWGRNVGRAWVKGMDAALHNPDPDVLETLERMSDDFRVYAHFAAVESHFYRAMPWPWRLRQRLLRLVGRG